MKKSLRKDEAIREFFDLFTENIRNGFYLDSTFTVDEMMAGFRGHCPFKVYLPNKPERYGLKIYAAVGCKSLYVSNMILYNGAPFNPNKQYNRPKKDSHKILSSQSVSQNPSQSSQSPVDHLLAFEKKNVKNEKRESIWDTVITLCKHLFSHGRLLCCDNYFGWKKLVLYCLLNKTDFIGTLRKNSDLYNKSLFSSLLVKSRLFHSNKLFYVQYKNNESSKKDVVVVTTLKSPIKLVSDKKGKPTAIINYNKTKGAVDTVDRMISSYSCARTNRRWPMRLFFHIVNVALHNSYILYVKSGYIISFDQFVNTLCMSLCEEYILNKIEDKKITNSELNSLFLIGFNFPVSESSKTGRCAFCLIQNKEKRKEQKERKRLMMKESKKNRKLMPRKEIAEEKVKRVNSTSMKCDFCSVSICGNHGKTVCLKCLKRRL